MTNNIEKTILFIKEKFKSADALEGFNWKYRYEHSLRVAGIGREIALKEGFDEEAMTIACLLHDIGYINCKTEEDMNIHGQISAEIAREYLTSINFNPERIETIFYGIKIHTEGTEDYDRIPTPFEISVGDADNIDRFDAYRLYANLRYYHRIDDMTPDQMVECAEKILSRYDNYLNFECGTKTAAGLWKDRIKFYGEYFVKLKKQMNDMQDFCKDFNELSAW